VHHYFWSGNKGRQNFVHLSLISSFRTGYSGGFRSVSSYRALHNDCFSSACVIHVSEMMTVDDEAGGM
jgi:hypothetical protein